MLNPMPTELEPLPMETKSMIRTPPQKAVWKQFMVRKVTGFSASRRKRSIASTSINSTMTMKSMKTMTDLLEVSICACAIIVTNLPYSRLDDVLEVTQGPQRVCICCNDKDHYAYSHNPERHEDALLPYYRLWGGHDVWEGIMEMPGQ